MRPAQGQMKVSVGGRGGGYQHRALCAAVQAWVLGFRALGQCGDTDADLVGGE